jgi:hypothetical protein
MKKGYECHGELLYRPREMHGPPEGRRRVAFVLPRVASRYSVVTSCCQVVAMVIIYGNA